MRFAEIKAQLGYIDKVGAKPKKLGPNPLTSGVRCGSVGIHSKEGCRLCILIRYW